MLPPKLMPVECDRVAWSLEAHRWRCLGLAWRGAAGVLGFSRTDFFPH